jgi:hypothetical protein
MKSTPVPTAPQHDSTRSFPSCATTTRRSRRSQLSGTLCGLQPDHRPGRCGRRTGSSPERGAGRNSRRCSSPNLRLRSRTVSGLQDRTSHRSCILASEPTPPRRHPPHPRPQGSVKTATQPATFASRPVWAQTRPEVAILDDYHPGNPVIVDLTAVVESAIIGRSDPEARRPDYGALRTSVASHNRLVRTTESRSSRG